MIFDQLEIRNVRNIANASLPLHPFVNIVSGPNGSGKTSLLESIHLLIRARSFRAGGVDALITHEKDELLVRATGRVDDATVRVGMQKRRKGKARMRLNGDDVRQVSKIAGMIPMQLFLPDLSELVFGEPARRRVFLDWGLLHVDPDYIQCHRDFRRALRQRNQALKRSSSELRVWTKHFVACARDITRARERLVAELRGRFVNVLEELAPELEIDLEYVPGWTKDSLLESLEIDRDRELKYGATRMGPHRSDIRLRLRDSKDGTNAKPASQILSRGQGKAVASALKIAQVQYLNNKRIATVVLLDDAAAEFDRDYGRRFFEVLCRTRSQVVATTTQEADTLDSWFDGLHAFTRMIHARKGRLQIA